MLLHFEAEQWLPLPVEAVFAFFANPANLPPLMPAWQKARIDAVVFRPPPPRPAGASEGIAAGVGTEITVTARPFPFSPFRGAWVARIEDFQWNQGFCDVQLKGPFAHWRHCHSVRPSPHPVERSPTGTWVRDAVDYELPLGGLGKTLDTLLTRPALERLFRYRQNRAYQILIREETRMGNRLPI